MTPSSGAISLADIRTELGMSGAISLGNATVRERLFVPSGAISLSNGYSVRQVTVSSSSIYGSSYSGTTVGGSLVTNEKLTVIHTPTSFIANTPSYGGGAAITFINFGANAKARLILQNDGTNYAGLMGCGSQGGQGGSATSNTAGAGSKPVNNPAGYGVLSTIPLYIQNSGVMFAGSGGGGGGGGAVYGTNGRAGGGGGGGAQAGGVGGSGGTASGAFNNAAGSAGGSTTTSWGGGGAGGVAPYVTAGAGGEGGHNGSAGQAGQAGVTGASKGAGGAGGDAGKVVAIVGSYVGPYTWEAYGTIYGTAGP